MTFEQLVLYLLVGGFALLQFLAKAWQRRRGSEREPQDVPEPTAQDPDDDWWNPPPEPAPPPEITVEATPAPVVAQARAPDRSAARPRPRQPVPQSRRPALVEPASQHRNALRNRAELRRTIELMAILGPPRSRAPEDP